jgi:multicomponent Na+:H+ antiporter subunit D
VSEALLSVPPWALLLVAAVAVLALPRRAGHAAAVGLSALVVPWAALVSPGVGPVVAPFGFEQAVVRVDGLARPVTALFGFVAAVNVLYGHATGADARQTACALGYMAAGVAAVVAGDWLTLLVAWELLAAASTVLVWHHGGRAVRVAFRYAVYHLSGGACLAAAVALHYAARGTFLYGDGFAPGLPTVLAVAGVGVNLGFVGVHAWLTETYPVPHVAASVVLAGFTTKVAVVALARVVPDGSLVVAWLGAAMVLYGVAQATVQTDMRRLLSYHIVSQVGYMVVAVGLGTAAGLAGGVAHLTAHVLYKGLLFMVAGAVVVRTGEESLKRLGGLGRRMPVTFVAFLVAAFAISGVPGFSGFVSKGLVVKAVEDAGGAALWWALVLGGVGTALSFAKFGYYAFVRPAPDDAPTVAASTPALRASLVVVAVPCVVLGLAPGVLLGAVPGDPGSFAPYAPSELGKAAATVGGGVLAFAVLRRPLARVPAVDVDRVLHPLAARAASAAALTAVRVGAAGAAVAGAGTARLGVAVGRPTDPDHTTGAALFALALTAALALLAVALAGVQP